MIGRIAQKRTAGHSCGSSFHFNNVSLFYLLLQHCLQFIHESIDVFEFTIDGSKSHVCDFVQVLQLIHHDLTDHATGNFLILHAEDLILYLVHKIGQLRCTDGTLVAGTENAGLDLLPVIGLTIVILLDDDQGNRLNLFIGGKSLSTFVTFPSAADGIVILSRSGIDHAGIFLITIGTLHFGSSLCVKYSFPVIILRFFLIYVNQNNVWSDLTNVLPTDCHLRFAPQKAKQLAGSRNHDLANAALALIKFQITNPSKPSAIPDIDHVLILEFRKRHAFPKTVFYNI